MVAGDGSPPAVANSNVLAPTTRPNPDAATLPSGQIPFAQSPFPSAAGANASTTNSSDSGESDAFKTGVKFQTAAIGNSGTQIFGGYFSEEYLSTLRGRQGAKKWDEMRRSEAQISMLMNAIMNPIKAANWTIDPFKENDPDSEKQAQLIRACIFEMIDFETFKGEALTVIPFGFCTMEVINSIEFNHPEFGTFNGLKALAFRSQKTIENWILQPQTGKLLGVNQYTYSDLGGNQFIPGDFLLVFTHLKEGDNYEGISALRPMLGAYTRKDLYLKIAAIGVERYAIGTPIGTVPKGKEKSLEFQQFEKVLQNYTSHESSFIIVPEGWNIRIEKGDFDASKIKELLLFENTEFANAVVGNFLALGMNGGGGAYALGSNLGEFFTTGIQAYANLIADVINRELIPNLVKLNFGPQRGYPKMKVTGITDKAGKDLAETIKFLADSRTLVPDDPLKAHIRKQYKFPKEDPATAVAMPVIPSGGATNFPKPSDPVVNPITHKIEPFNPNQLSETIKLAEGKYVKRFDNSKSVLKELMQTELAVMYAELKDLLRKKYNAASGSDKILVASKIDMPGVQAYRILLRDALAECATQAIRQVSGQVKRVKLSEQFDALSPAVRKLIDAQSSLVAETQAADIEKMTFFQFTSAASSLDDLDAILNEVDGKVIPTLEGSTGEGMSIDVAAGDALAQVIQGATMDFFSSPDVIDQIESFTFTNEDPVSECCQALAGTTFAVGDPDLGTYQPPLHHLCKSRYVPNYKASTGNPEIDRGGVSLTKKALNAITLSERKYYRLSEDAGRVNK